jgi:hypothetical protein
LTEASAKEQERMAGNGTVDSTDLMLAWIRLVFETLGAPLECDDRQVPGWASNQSLPAQLFQHWREVPLVRSRR